MYIFNAPLLREVRKLFDIRQPEVLEAVGVPRSSWYHWLQSGDLPLLKLITLCNHLHVPVSHFVIPEESPSLILSVSDYVHSGRWSSIYFDSQAMGDALTLGCHRTVVEASSSIGMSHATFYRYFRPYSQPHTLFVCEFLRVCNEQRLYPGLFLIDLNREIEKSVHFSVGEFSSGEKLRMAYKRIQELEKNNRFLSTRLAELSAQLKKHSEVALSDKSQ